MESIKQILVSVLVDEWYYGLVLALIVDFAFIMLLEELEKSVGRGITIIIGTVGIGANIWLAAALFGSHPFFASGLLIILALVVFLAIPSKKKKDEKKAAKNKKKAASASDKQQ